VFYQMLTGQKPFVEDSKRSVLQKIRLERYTQARKINPDVPRPLERVLSRCMAKVPADRYASMQALIHDIEDFLASRIIVNYNAYMVKFLEDQGVLSENEASTILSTGGERADKQRVVQEDRNVLRSLGLVHAIVLGFLLLGGLVIQLSSSDAVASKRGASAGYVVSPNEVGYLKVVANPWAKVHVDGQAVATTPIATPLPLSPGVHFVELVHPVFETVKKEVEIKPGETVEIIEQLARKQTGKPRE